MTTEREVSESEWKARVELAAVYRLCAHYGWGYHIYNHVSMRLPDEPDCFLVKQHRLLYEEVCASNLIKLRIDGTQLEGGEKVNPAGFTIHTAVLKSRPEINSTLHFHGRAGMAISAHPIGLLPLTQGSMRFYNRLSYHEFEGLALDMDETTRLQRDLGPKNRAMVLRNHGLLTCGATLSDALTLAKYLDDACAVQLMLLATGCEPRIPSPEICEHTAQQYERNEATGGAEDEWRAYLRLADKLDPSFRN